jgi:serine/threonine protein kinase/Tfp pilus assembly protein PilF
MIGNTISHYKVIEKLGEGGMGTVYLAEDLQLKRKVALKFLPHELIRDTETRTRFVYEAQAASALDHPNIGTIYEINESEENAFIAMAYYDGGTLLDKIRQKELSIEQAIKITMCIAEGIQKAHNKNIVHRDIKPANILFSEDGEPKVIDFGLAKFLGQSILSRTGTTVGTIAYMSPEQAMGKKIDHRTDIWALGVILYEILAGENPFKGEYDQAMMYSIVNEDPEFISKIRPDVPLEVEKIIDRALNKNPEKRFQSMQEMWEALRDSISDIETGKSKTASVFRLGKRQRRLVLRFAPIVFVFLSIFAYFAFVKDVIASPVAIALLPLENISRDAEQEWFTEGMTDALITDLARINNLRIISRKSAMKYKGSEKSSAEIAAELGVSYIIEGSVIKTEDLVKISVRLIDAASDKYMWAQGYKRDFKDVLSLQGDVARAIARQIEVNLTPNEETYLVRKRTVNPEAHEAYLKGKFYWFKLNRQALETALQYFELAVKLDPDYAPAYAGIALVWGGRAQNGYVPMQIAGEKARSAVAKALELDDSIAEVHYVNAIFQGWWGDWNAELAAASLENVIRLKPNMAEVRAYYSHILFILKRPEEGIEQIEHALKLDPFNELFIGLYGMCLNFAYRYDEAIKVLQQALQKSPGVPIFLTTLRTSYHQKKMYKESLEIWRLSFEASGDLQSIAAMDSGYAEGGYSMALRRIAESKIIQSKSKYISPNQIATLYTRAGMPDEALKWLEKSLEVRDPDIPYLKVDPIYDYMREDPRFKELIRKAGL